MDKKEALLRSLAELKAAHERASAALAIVINTAAKAIKGQEVVPSLTDIRHYKKAIMAAKGHALQAEMVLTEYMQPRLPLDDPGSPHYAQ